MYIALGSWDISMNKTKQLAFQERRMTINNKYNKVYNQLKYDKYYGKKNNQKKAKEISSTISVGSQIIKERGKKNHTLRSH